MAEKLYEIISDIGQGKSAEFQIWTIIKILFHFFVQEISEKFKK